MTPDQPTGMNELQETLQTLLDEFNELTHELRFKNEDLHLLPGDVKLLREKIFTEAEAAIQEIVEQCPPAKKTLETDLPLDADEDDTKFCVECGQWEYEGVLDCKCVGFNEAIDQCRHNLQQAGLLRGGDVTKGGTE